MIDHVSIAVRDLSAAEAFYTAALAPLGMTKLREWPEAAIGFGKKYPEFWINGASAWTVSPTITACTFACAPRTQRRSTRFSRRRSRPAAHPTARRACGRIITRAIMPLSSGTSTATASRR